MIVNSQLSDLHTTAKEYEQQLLEVEAKNGVHNPSTQSPRDERSWWDQLLAPFFAENIGLCCDSSDVVCTHYCAVY